MRGLSRLLMMPCFLLPLTGGAEQDIPQKPDFHRLAQTNPSLEPRLVADPQPPFTVPLPAHVQPRPPESRASFSVQSSHKDTASSPKESARAEYLLPESKTGEMILPESANLNLPKDTELVALDTGEKITLPAGTYRQILTFPIGSPLLAEKTRSKDLKSTTAETDKPKSRHAAPPSDPIWVRYESLEKIRIGDVERRGGLDVPSHGPKDLGPRVWYAKSETADIASSAFYFVFGGLGYGVANLAGWSAGNTREVANDFEYRLVRR